MKQQKQAIKKKQKPRKINEDMKEALVRLGHVEKGITLYKNY